MRRFDYLIIGGGVSGTAAAELLRERERYSSVAILGGEEYPLYSRVLIPHYLKNRISRDALFLRKISDYEERGIAFFPSVFVSRLDLERREAYAAGGETFPYKKLLIASGGKPNTISFGLPEDLMKVLRMHTVKDADEIKEILKSYKNKEALVVGENFIALEFIETFLVNGFRVHASARSNFFNEKRFGALGGAIIEEVFKKNGVIIHKKAEIKSFYQGEIYLSNGEKVPTNLAGVGIGIESNFQPFSGLKTNKGILTNEFLETSDPNVYASGDVAEYFDGMSGVSRTSGNWTTAFLQGKTAALNMLGGHEVFRSVPTYNINHLGLGIASLGFTDDADEIWEHEGSSTHMFGLARVFLKEGRVAGALLINRFNDKITLARLIEEKRAVLKDELAKILA